MQSSTQPYSSQSPRGVYISTYGCQMNVNDSERMYSILEMMNYNSVPTPDEADLIIINSCSVREKPVHKVYSEAGTFRKLKEKNPQLKIGVGGCVGNQEKDKLIQNQPLIDFVFGTDNIDQLPEILTRVERPGQKTVETNFHHKAPYDVETMIRNPGVTAFVNITKGCDNFCTFCVVPFTRGREKSRSLKQLISDVQALVRRGVKEVTLLGQNVNSYKSECGADFADLLAAVAQDSGLQRLRYTTSHPKDFNEKLAKVMARHQDVICEYIHLPAQSGNNRILDLMNRGYTRQEYSDKLKMIRDHLPNAVFSTDLIVGFPGETEAEFEDTVSLLNEAQYETIFAFMYSSRPQTKAARMEGHLSEEVKSRRLQELFAAQDKLAFPMAQRYMGQNLQVLVESYDDNRKQWFGRSTQNKNVYFTGENIVEGSTQEVQIQTAFPTVLRGVKIG